MPNDNDLVKVYFQQLNERINRFEILISKLFDNQTEMMTKLERNVVSFEDSKQKNIAFESILEKMGHHISDITSKLVSMERDFSGFQRDVHELEEDMTIVKKHVDKVDRTIFFFSSLPSLVKVIVLCLTLITSGYGCYVIIKPKEEVTR